MEYEHTINFTIQNKPSEKIIEMYKRMAEGCTYLIVMDEDGINVEKSYCSNCGYDLNKCKTYCKSK